MKTQGNRALALTLALLLCLSLLAGCGAGTGSLPVETDAAARTDENAAPAEPTQDGAPAAVQPHPTGLYMLKYLGDETGAYVPESNEYLDYFNQPVTLMQMMWNDNDTIWCEFLADGTGSFHSPSREPVTIDFSSGETGKLLFGDELLPFCYDEAAGRFWFEEEPGFWDVMEACSQEALDLVFAGLGGTMPLAEAKVGDLVCLGSFPQSDSADTMDPIRWRVIDRDGDRALLLCEKLLDSFSYNYNPDHAVLTDVTWENSSLRAFLNRETEDGFLSLFTADEIARMQTTHLENRSANEELMAQWGMLEDQGEATYSDLATQNRPDDPDTDDRVFLLSYQEVLRYLGEPTEPAPEGQEYPFSVLRSNPNWIAYVTDAVKTGYFDNVTRGGAWMTRTLCWSHTEEDMVVYIGSTGQVFDYFTYVPLLIRPAVWISTN